MAGKPNKTVYILDSNLRVIKVIKGHKEAGRHFRCTADTVRTRLFQWRRHWRNKTLTVVKPEHYKEVLLHEIGVTRREISDKKIHLESLKNEFRKYFKL